MDLLQPTFGETDSYKSLREFLDTAITGFQYLHKIFLKTFKNSNNYTDVASNSGLESDQGMKKISLLFSNIGEVISELGTSEAPVDVFNM